MRAKLWPWAAVWVVSAKWEGFRLSSRRCLSGLGWESKANISRYLELMDGHGAGDFSIKFAP